MQRFLSTDSVYRIGFFATHHNTHILTSSVYNGRIRGLQGLWTRAHYMGWDIQTRRSTTGPTSLTPYSKIIGVCRWGTLLLENKLSNWRVEKSNCTFMEMKTTLSNLKSWAEISTPLVDPPSWWIYYLQRLHFYNTDDYKESFEYLGDN